MVAAVVGKLNPEMSVGEKNVTKFNYLLERVGWCLVQRVPSKLRIWLGVCVANHHPLDESSGGDASATTRSRA